MSDRVVTFGEIMGRLDPPGFNRFAQALPGPLRMSFAGAEANVAASLACLGRETRFVTAIPDHTVADGVVKSLRALGIDTHYILRRNEGRLGLYFVETGANQRPSVVIYDRDGATIALTEPEAYPWEEIFADSGWFHVTGITPAVSETASRAALMAVQTAKAVGLTVSVDLNFRSKLWRWDSTRKPRELAEATMRQILPYVDLVIGNEEDASDVLSIRAKDTDVTAGKVAAERYVEVAETIIAQFPNVSRVAFTLRESISASYNRWGAVLYDSATSSASFAPLGEDGYRPYEIHNIVDRVGGGDSFTAALIYALTTEGLNEESQAVAFAAAASCLAHSIPGDFNYSTRAEVERLMGGSGSGRVIR
jgi:2-dehydro-3-deoxygluconokinase